MMTTDSHTARIFTLDELERGMRKYVQAGLNPMRVDHMARFVYDHYGQETDTTFLEDTDHE